MPSWSLFFFFFNLINKKFDVKLCPAGERGIGREKGEPQDFSLASRGLLTGVYGAGLHFTPREKLGPQLCSGSRVGRGALSAGRGGGAVRPCALSRAPQP